MIFRARNLDLKIFEFEVKTVKDALFFIENYEKENNTALRVFEKSTGKRIIGGKLTK